MPAPHEISNTPHYAGFGVRLLAHLIDTLLSILILVAVIMIVGLNFLLGEGLTGVTGFIVNWVLPALIIILFWRLKGATPGKMVMGLEIVDVESLQRPSTLQLTIRYFAYFVSFIPLMFGFWWIFWDKKKQGWHDKLASTVVIRTKAG